MKSKLHAAAGTLALVCIATFWISSISVELAGDPAAIARVKMMILWSMMILIPAMVTAGATGASLGRGWRLPQVSAKSRRMKFIAANGLIVLLPSAVFLALRAGSDRIDTVFYVVQLIELGAGAVNIVLLSLNLRDGLSLRSRRPTRT